MTAELTEMLHEPALSTDDVAVLNRARTILGELDKEAERRAWEAPKHGLDEANPQSWGRLAEVASVAEHMLFQVLNVASSYRCQELTKEQIHNETAPDVTVSFNAEVRDPFQGESPGEHDWRL